MARTVAAQLPHFPLAAAALDLAGFQFLGDAPLVATSNRAREDRDRAVREAVAETRATFDRERTEERADFALRLTEREQAVTEGLAGTLLGRLEAGLAELETRLAAEVSRVLTGFLAGAVRDRALGELVETVRALLAPEAGVAVKVVGPERLVEALRVQLGQADAAIAFTTDQGAPDVSVTVNDTVIQTRIAAWMARLAGPASENAVG